MKLLFLLPAALAASLAVAAPVRAETPEESVAYAFLGLSDGGSIKRAATEMNWKEATPSPAVFDGDVTVKSKPAQIHFTVKAVDPCHYEIIISGPPQLVPGARRLYAKVALDEVGKLTPTGDGFKMGIAGDGFCETGTMNPDCHPVDNTDLFGSVEPTRHAASVASLASVCPPKPTQ